ncbi:MAG: PAS domain S-box protein, partial [Candidatus Aminicenantes bacterium]|nr:PAS domain S-box protein [Candidatus Aminicenantes bacterium]
SLSAPLMLIFFLKIREGTIVSVIFLSLNIFLTLLNIFPSVYTGRFLARYTGVYITIVLMSFIYGRIQERTRKGLESTNLTLNNTINKLSATKRGLQQSEERYRALVENSSDGIGILRDFRFIYVNTKLSDMSGYSKDELLKKPLTHILKSDSRELSNRIFDIKTLSGDIPKERIELHLKAKTGEIIEVEVGTNMIEYEDEKSQLISVRDVRDRNLVEKERTKIANLESFRMVANGVTHDFNNILTIIMGNLELIKLNRKGNPKLDNPLKRIEEASSRASELLDDLYVFSTSAVKEESLENIMEIIEAVLEPLQSEYIGTEFRQESDDDLWELRCDRKQICIAMKNILLNSLDATEGKAHVEISVSKFLNKNRVLPSLKNKEFLRISIKDSGKGIPEENLGRIFDPYFSTKGNVTEKGIGLGLAIANKIILDHNGLIKVQSKSGTGTTFEIFLPAEVN